jgi:hypothetical protein
MHGGRPLALFDFGCSAGLNLSVDAMRVAYRHADGNPWFDAGCSDADAPVLACRLLNERPPTPAWHIAHRLGVDRAPVSLDDEGALRWLRACLWPGETARAERFERALALARAARHHVRAADDGLAVLAAWLRELPAGVTPVLFNSWVLAYFTADDLASHTSRVLALVREHGLVWLSAEDDERLAATTGLRAEPPRDPSAPQPPPGAQPRAWRMAGMAGAAIIGPSIPIPLAHVRAHHALRRRPHPVPQRGFPEGPADRQDQPVDRDLLRRRRPPPGDAVGPEG